MIISFRMDSLFTFLKLQNSSNHHPYSLDGTIKQVVLTKRESLFTDKENGLNRAFITTKPVWIFKIPVQVSR